MSSNGLRKAIAIKLRAKVLLRRPDEELILNAVVDAVRGYLAEHLPTAISEQVAHFPRDAEWLTGIAMRGFDSLVGLRDDEEPR